MIFFYFNMFQMLFATDRIDQKSQRARFLKTHSSTPGSHHEVKSANKLYIETATFVTLSIFFRMVKLIS